MYEVACASCNGSFQYNVEDYIHFCPFCSSGFVLDLEEGAKELIGDHYIIPNRIDRQQIEETFQEWVKTHYHRPDLIKKEFSILGIYGISLPYWVISLEAHTYWSGHSIKSKQYPGQPIEYGSRFAREDGRFSRRYRWAILARKSPKEHWGIERLHHPREKVMVDWDGFPLDETLGVSKKTEKSAYEVKVPFKFEHSNGLTVAGVQVKESAAITRARDQVQEFHRRICKTKVGTLYEHRTEIEIVGIHLVHLPFWFLRYAFIPASVFKFFTSARERRVLVQGYTQAILDAEMPLNSTDKVMTNLFVCGSLALISLTFSILVNILFFVLFLIFSIIAALSAWKIFHKEKLDTDLMRGSENDEPTF